jgi:hypothetical protein
MNPPDEDCMKKQITAERLRELLDYNPETGVFTRNVRTSNSVQVGEVAGCVMNKGYVHIVVDGAPFLAHRLAWLHQHGDWPTGMIDHIDGDRTNNAASNLRQVTNSLNCQNQRKAKRSNVTGLLGVAPGRTPGTYRACIYVNRRQLHLGTFKTPEQAHAAYIAAKREHHTGCTI